MNAILFPVSFKYSIAMTVAESESDIRITTDTL